MRFPRHARTAREAFRRPRWIALVAVLLSCLPVSVGAATPSDTPRAPLLKAAYLYHFLDFVAWPDSIDGTLVRVGILGDDPFGPVVDEVFAGPADGARRFAIERSDDVDGLRDCHLVFFGLETADAIAAALDALRDLPVLTVAQHPGFAARGGHVNFFVEDERLRFEINLDATQAAGLRPSARLLKLARIVDPEAERRLRR